MVDFRITYSAVCQGLLCPPLLSILNTKKTLVIRLIPANLRGGGAEVNATKYTMIVKQNFYGLLNLKF